MQIEEKKIKEILLKENIISTRELKKAEEYVRADGMTLFEYLISQGIVGEEMLSRTIAKAYGLEYIDLKKKSIAREQVLRVPDAIGKKFRVVLVGEDSKHVTFATDLLPSSQATKVLKELFKNKNVEFVFTSRQNIENSFVYYRKALETRFVKIVKEQKRVAPEIVDLILDDALNLHASDVHFEPQEGELVIRFRIDGVMQEVARLDMDNYENILNLIKVQAHLRTDEHFSAQDGAIRYKKDEKAADVRISIVPILDGEKVVMRVLSEYLSSFSLDGLGFTQENEKIVLEAANKPFGMILVTGPTGSGKTTTLYGLLKILNSPEVNISTIEDPVEYKIPGVNHIQVNTQTNLTFAEGLRSIVRQDPDIVLVGEIRDDETAEIAVNAALTGHLLLSTFHANDAATAIPRLLDMEVEPFLLASTLELVIAQRLVRCLCEKCKQPTVVSFKDIEKLIPNAKRYFAEKSLKLFSAKGCESCAQTGYRGRVGIFEFIQNTPDMQDLILKNPSTRQIWELAKKLGSKSLFEDGVLKVKQGLTTLEELLRVASPAQE